jgi:hypothetical protein
MTPKKRLAIIIAVILLIILLVLLVWFLLNKKSEPIVQPIVPEVSQTIPRQSAAEETAEKNIPEVPAVVQNGLESLAKTFAERYGSYSSESDFANLRDILGLMSVSMRQKTEEFIVGSLASGTYYGVTTRVLSVKTIFLDEDAGAASLEINTQREESKGSPNKSEVEYQKLVLNYVMEDGVWKVDSANWQEL